MLLIIFLGLIAELTSVSGDCFVEPQNVNINWDKLTGGRDWYHRLHTPGSIDSNLRCYVQNYAHPRRSANRITTSAYNITSQRRIRLPGFARNRNSTSWEEVFPTHECRNGRNYPIAVDYNRYFIYKFCFYENNQLVIRVAYREPVPEEETVNIVKEKLKENGIEYDDLVDWSMSNCK